MQTEPKFKADEIEEGKLLISHHCLAEGTFEVDGEEIDVVVSQAGDYIRVEFEQEDVDDILFDIHDIVSDATAVAFDIDID